MKVLFIDTETTGIPDKWAPFDHPDAPRVVQLGAVLSAEDGATLAQLDLLIRPEGWEVPDGARAIHGITTDRCRQAGVPIALAMTALNHLGDLADLVAAHNAPFDRSMLEIEACRLPEARDCGDPTWIASDWFCTMGATTPICRIPGHRGWKWPRLTEAYRHFFNEDFDHAHSALADVHACKRIYFELLRRQQTAAPATGGQP